MAEEKQRNRLISWLSEQALEAILGKLATHIPTIITAMGAALGIYQGIPWTYLIASASVTFGGLSVGLLRFSEWRQRNQIDGKLVIGGTRLGNDGGTGLPLFVLDLFNRAPFPMSVSIEDIRCSIASIIPENTDETNFLNQVLQPVSPGRTMFHSIKIPENLWGKELTGFCSANIKYGKGTKLIHSLKLDQECRVWLDQKGQVEKVSMFDRKKAR